MTFRTTSDIAIAHRERQRQLDRKRARAELAAQNAIGKQFEVTHKKAGSSARIIYKGTIVKCTVRGILEVGRTIKVVWNMTLRSPSGSKDRDFCVSKLPE